jgi:hypothetical protein
MIGQGEVDTAGPIWYMGGLEVEIRPIVGLCLPRIPIRFIEEDAACRFSFAITMSTKPSRR